MYDVKRLTSVVDSLSRKFAGAECLPLPISILSRLEMPCKTQNELDLGS